MSARRHRVGASFCSRRQCRRADITSIATVAEVGVPTSATVAGWLLPIVGAPTLAATQPVARKGDRNFGAPTSSPAAQRRAWRRSALSRLVVKRRKAGEAARIVGTPTILVEGRGYCCLAGVPLMRRRSSSVSSAPSAPSLSHSAETPAFLASSSKAVKASWLSFAFLRSALN